MSKFDDRIDAKNAKFWVLFSGSEFKDIKKTIIAVQKSDSGKAKDAKDKVEAALFIANAAQNGKKKLSEAVDEFGNRMFTKDGKIFYKVSGKTFDNRIQSGNKVVYFNGAPEGFDGLAKILKDPPKGAEVVNLRKNVADKVNAETAASLQRGRQIMAAKELEKKEEQQSYEDDPVFLWMSQRDVDNMKQELFGSDTKDEVGVGYGLVDALLACIPGSNIAKTALKAKTMAAPVAKKAMQQAVVKIAKYGATDAVIGGAGIALEKIADTIVGNEDSASDSSEANIAPKAELSTELSFMQKASNMAGQVGGVMKNHALTISALAAITIGLVATYDKWSGYLKKLFTSKKKDGNVVGKCIVDIDSKPFRLLFDIDKMKWIVESSKARRKEIKEVASQLPQTEFFSKLAMRMKDRLDSAHRQLELPDIISKLSSSKDITELVDKFKKNWLKARNNIFEIDN